MNFREAIITLLFFTFLTLIFFHKIFFSLIPLPTDLIVGAYYPWLSYKWGNYNLGVPVQNPKLSDAVSLYYPFKSLSAEFVKKGEWPLWNPYMFGGYPLFANVQAGLLFPTMIFYLLFSSPVAWTLQVMSQPILAAFFMYLLLRHLHLSKLPSVFGSIVYGFGGATILWIQWNTQATTTLFLPILILLEDKYLTSKKLKWGALLSIFICLQIFAGYLPVIPFTFVCMALWYLFRSAKISDLKILLFFVLGILLSTVFLLPVVELIRISQRTVETLQGGNPFFAVENLINLIAPDFFGNPATGNFWGKGDNMDTTIYAGITTLVFSILGLRNFFNKTEVKFALCLFFVALIISISNPISNFLYNLGLWGGSSITMNRVNFLPNFSLAILGAYGLSIVKSHIKFNLKPAIWILAIILGTGIGLIFTKFFFDINQSLTRIDISLRNLLLPLFMIIVTVLSIYFCNQFKRFRLIGSALFIVILIFELFRFGLKFNTFSSPDFIYPETPISNFLKKYPNDRFVAEKDIFPANMWTPFKLSSIAGYDGVYPLNTAKFLAAANSNRVDTPPQPRWGILENFNSRLLDLSNTKFMLSVKRDSTGKVSDKGEVANMLKLPKFKKVFEDKRVVILENMQAFPRVYVTKNVIKASDSESLKYMINDSLPIKDTSLSDFEWTNSSGETLTENLTYKQIANNHVLIKTTTNMDSYLVVLDSYYPGWKASIDGKETAIHRTNYNFRGIILPKGNHIVEFKYFPDSFKYGAIISGVSLIIIIFLLSIPRLAKER